MKLRCWAWLCGACCFLSAAPLQAAVCDALPAAAGYERLSFPRLELAYRFTPAPLQVGMFFAVEVVACPAPGAPPLTDLRLDARMPAHGHGMNYRPTVTRISPEHFRFEGLMLHMPGHWELTFEVYQDGPPTRRTHDVEL